MRPASQPPSFGSRSNCPLTRRSAPPSRGGGAAVLSETVVAAALRAGTLVRAAFDLPSRPFRVLRHKERYRSRAADALLDLIATANAG